MYEYVVVPNQATNATANVKTVLNNFGAQGWRLVETLNFGHPMRVSFVLEREIGTKPDIDYMDEKTPEEALDFSDLDEDDLKEILEEEELQAEKV